MDDRNDHLQTMQSLIRSFSMSGSKQDFLDNVIRLVQLESGCKCVGIRVLDENGYIPYQSYVGFSREFWEAENMIQISKDDCSCTRIVSGKILSCDQSIINKSGSLYCNDTLSFVRTLSKSELVFFRGACVKAGYLSLAIIPIGYRGAVIGLVHLAEVRTDQLRQATVDFVESIVPLIGEVINRHKIEQSLKTSQDNVAILESIVGGISSLAYIWRCSDHNGWKAHRRGSR